MTRVLVAATALALLGGGLAHAAESDTIGRTTLEQRVVPAEPAGPPYRSLTIGPGDRMDVRGDLAAPQDGRSKRRRSLAYLAQLSDFQLADEESPARVEFIDQLASAVSAAWRPQEALLPFVVDASIRQVDTHTRSPFPQRGGKRARLGFAILTGDNADNNQRNEAVWVDTLLDGGRLEPGSGRADAEALQGKYCLGADAAALAAEAPRYTGVQDADDAGANPIYYDPDAPGGHFSAWPAYPGLMDRAQQPFEAAGLDVPSYVALGNHDGLVQGNQAATAVTNDIARGCFKPLRAPAVSSTEPGAPLEALLNPQPQNGIIVPPDPDRVQVTKAQYRQLFATGGQADAHGFTYVDPAELEASAGAASYYDFSPVPGLRMVALDTITDAGITGPGSEGNLDDPQFRWLERTLQEAEAADELVIVYSHHGPQSMASDLPDEIAGPCDDPQAPSNPGCDGDPRTSTPIHLGEDVTALLLRYPHAIAWVAGHSHVNDVAFAKRTSGAPGGFWIVRTSAEADYPHQDRLIDVMDNRDGTLSLLTVLLDNAAPSAAPAPGTPAAGMSTDDLASLARTFGLNDPQGDPDAVGEEQDRNVELLLPDPRRDRDQGMTTTRRKLRVKVKPRRVVAGRRTVLKVRVRRAGKPVRRKLVRVAGKRARTGRRGRARIVVRFKRTGIRHVRVGRVRAPVLVVRR